MTGGTAVILGKTGRNLAAGMSGGTAYVHLLRADMLNQPALKDNEIELIECDSADEDFLRQVLEKHFAETESTLARRMLDDFSNEVKNFTKIVPRDYALVRKVQQQATIEGLSLDSSEVWSRILEVSTNG
jgi:glutamate synthase (NADPH/NADH) large chain